MSSKLRIGVAGAGVFGAHHAAKYAAHDQAALTAIFDVERDRANSLADRFGVAAYRDYSEFLRDLDAVIIAAPATVHFELARDALKAGCHIFVEKPLALCAADADKLIEVAAEKQRVLQVGHQERYVFDAAGLFGRDRAPTKIDCARRGSTNGRCEDVSVVFDLMVHDLDLVRQLTNAELLDADAHGCADEVSAALQLSNGTIAALNASRRASSLERHMTLTYDDGVIEFDFIKREISNSTPAILDAGFANAEGAMAYSDPLGFGANQFIAAISSGHEPIVSGRHGRIAVDWAERIEGAIRPSLDIDSDLPERIPA